MNDGFPYNRALVTGGAGFIGSHLAERLAGLGVETASYDDYSAGARRNLAGLRGRVLEFEGDVSCERGVARCFERFRPEVVFHLAASKKTVCLENPRRDLEVNAGGTLNLLLAALRHGARKFVHVSTGSVYGWPARFPQDEAHPLRPISYYGVSKLAGERYADVFHREHGLDVTIVRPFHVYGPRQRSADERGGVVGIFCRRALEGLPLAIHGDGEQVRSFTYVDDVVEALLTVAACAWARGETYNCASGTQVSVNALAESVLALAGGGAVEHDGPRPGEAREFEVDNSKLAALGVREWTALADGLRETFEWYRKELGGRE